MRESAQASIIVCILCSILSAVVSRQQSLPKFVLGGLFPIHQKGDGPDSCGEIMKEKGIQRAEAMLYAIEEINKKERYYGFSLEAKILDTCSHDSHALNESLKFLKVQCGATTGQRVTGVIGAANSPVSESVATIFRLFQIPQISYASTSTELDDKHKYPYFFRVVPSDKFQVVAIVKLLKKLNWTYLSTVAAKGEYGENAVQELHSYVREDDICFGATVTIPRNAKDDDYKDAVKQLKKESDAKAVVVFLNEDKLKKLFTAAKRMGVKGKMFQWLGSDSWGAKDQVVSGFEDIVEGAITILPMKFPVLTEFDEYFKALKPSHHNSNEWFREFWEDQFDCKLDNSISYASDETSCYDEDLRKTNYTQEGLVPMVVDAVYVMAHALKNLCSAERYTCQNGSEPPPGEKLKSYIEKVSIPSSREHGMTVSFDSNRSVPVNYTIYQFQKDASGIYKYIPLGSWSKDGLELDAHPIETTASTCGKPCGPRWEREYTNTKKKCCWTCKQCPVSQYVPSPRSSCTACKEGLVLNSDATKCIWVHPEYFGMDMGSAWTVIPFVFAVLGSICCVLMYVTFWIYHSTPVIMASGRELCHLIYLGVFLCYCFTFVMVSHPTPFGCGLVRVGLGLGLAVCYSAIFTKTNRISRIFNRTVRNAKRPRYITPKSQLIICLCLVMIELTLSAIWLLLEPPKVMQQQLDKGKPLVETCEMHDETVCLALTFNVMLIMMCTFYAFKTRKIPENFNEAKYISFVMYSTCIIWMAFVPTYFSVSSDYKVRSTLLCMSISMSGTVALVCIFVPKLYIVIFQPQKNVRYPTTTNSATAAYTGPIRYIKTTPTTHTLTPETEVRGTENSPSSQNARKESRIVTIYESSESNSLDGRKVSQV